MHDLPLVKMQATGNSFVLVDGHGLPELDWAALDEVAEAQWRELSARLERFWAELKPGPSSRPS